MSLGHRGFEEGSREISAKFYHEASLSDFVQLATLRQRRGCGDNTIGRLSILHVQLTVHYNT